MKKRTRNIDLETIKKKAKTRKDFEDELNELRVMLVKKAQDYLQTGDFDAMGEVLKTVGAIDKINPKPETDLFLEALEKLGKARQVSDIDPELVAEAERYLTHREEDEDVLMITDGGE